MPGELQVSLSESLRQSFENRDLYVGTAPSLPKSGSERESAFVASSFWMVQNLAGAGRSGAAESLFENLV
jgi:hypothetical protein